MIDSQSQSRKITTLANSHQIWAANYRVETMYRTEQTVPRPAAVAHLSRAASPGQLCSKCVDITYPVNGRGLYIFFVPFVPGTPAANKVL